MVVVPAVRPVTTPPVLTEATVGAVLLHVPPPDASVSVVLRPEHTEKVPAMATGGAVTVTDAVAKPAQAPAPLAPTTSCTVVVLNPVGL